MLWKWGIVKGGHSVFSNYTIGGSPKAAPVGSLLGQPPGLLGQEKNYFTLPPNTSVSLANTY